LVSGLGVLLSVLWGVEFALTVVMLRTRSPRPLARWRQGTALLAVVGLVMSLAARDWAAAGFSAATLALLLRDWWNRKGKRAAGALGAKSAALLAAVIQKAREAGTPMPEGAGA
jgi:hypothetical protein